MAALVASSHVFVVQAINLRAAGRCRGLHEADGITAHRYRLLLDRFEVRAAVAPAASMPVADEDVEDVKLDRAGHGLLARHQAEDSLERDAVDIDLTVHDRTSREDARELLSDVRQMVGLPTASTQDQVVRS